MVCWFFSFWRHFDLVKWVKFGGVSGHFLEKVWWEWPKILHAGESWPPSELIGLWLQSVDIINFGGFLLSEMGKICGFRVFSGEYFEERAWNFVRWCILSTLIKNWLNSGCSLLIFLILVPCWLDEMGQIWGFRAFSGERIEGMAWNVACGCILTTFRTGHGLLIFSCDQAALWMVFSVRLSHLFDYVPRNVSSWNCQELSSRTSVRFMQKFKVRSQRSRPKRSQPNLTFSEP